MPEICQKDRSSYIVIHLLQYFFCFFLFSEVDYKGGVWGSFPLTLACEVYYIMGKGGKKRRKSFKEKKTYQLSRPQQIHNQKSKWTSFRTVPLRLYFGKSSNMKWFEKQTNKNDSNNNKIKTKQKKTVKYLDFKKYLTSIHI